jgi:hypothetical protein
VYGYIWYYIHQVVGFSGTVLAAVAPLLCASGVGVLAVLLASAGSFDS